MRILITGASGNVGTALLQALRSTHPEWAITGICRRPPTGAEAGGSATDEATAAYAPVEWYAMDLAEAQAGPRLGELLTGVDAVVHLAWALQPTHDQAYLSRVNLEGSRRVFAAVRNSGIAQLIHASSVGAYAQAPDKPYVTEEWPLAAVATSSYSVQKVQLERELDILAKSRPELAVARLRPGLVLQGLAGAEISRYFLGRLSAVLPITSRLPLPVVPLPRGLLAPVVHADDLAAGIVRMLERRIEGPVNFSAGTPVTGELLARMLGGRLQEVPPRLVRTIVSVSWRTRIQPVDAGWFDLAMGVPLLDTERAARELDWRPRRTTEEALKELLTAMSAGQGSSSPVLAPRNSRGG